MSIYSQPMNENLERRRPRRQCRQNDGAPILEVDRRNAIQPDASFDLQPFHPSGRIDR